MTNASICDQAEYAAVAANVAHAIDARGRPSIGCLLMVGLSLVECAVTQMDDGVRHEVRQAVGAMLDPAATDGPGAGNRRNA